MQAAGILQCRYVVSLGILLCLNGSSVSDAVARGSAAYGAGSGPIVLSNVMCSGSEQRLLQCQHDALDVGSCGHGEDVGVECFMGEILDS